MKKKYLLLGLFILPFVYNTFAEVLLNETFNTSSIPSGWQTNSIQGTEVWEFNNTPLLSSNSGGYYAVFDDYALGASVTPNESDLISPSLNCTGKKNIRLKYTHYWYAVEFTHAYVEISNDGGGTWNLLVEYESITKGSLNNPQDTIIDISAYANNQNNVKVRFRYTDGSQVGKYWYLDDISIYTANDVGIINLIEPNYLQCNDTFSSSDSVKVEIYNFTTDTIWNIPVVCDITGDLSTTLTETYTGFIEPLSSVIYKFNTAIDLSGLNKKFNFTAYTNLSIDSLKSNDTVFSSKQSLVTSFPYNANFNNFDDAWFTSGSNTFERGIFSKMNGNIGYGNSWITHLNESYNNNENSYLLSPIFDFTTYTVINIQYDYKYYTESCCDYTYFQYSLNNGATWVNASPQYKGDSYATWNHANFEIDFNTCDLSCVQFRFWFHSDGSVIKNGGFTFDDITININTDSVDISLESLQFHTKCIYGNAENLGVVILNNTAKRICNNITLTSIITHPTQATQTLSDIYLGGIAPNSTLNYTFSTTADLSNYNSGDYEIKTFFSLASDSNSLNDTIIQIIPKIINSFPYLENFNSSNSDWHQTGNFDFEKGSFSKMNGNSGFGNSWVTKIIGNYNNNQNTYVESPIFDFTNVTCPSISFDYKYYTESCCDYAYIQYSTDGGVTYNNLVGNWKGNGYSSWNHQEQLIQNLVGNSCVIFRFWFHSDGSSVRDGGFAFDNIIITDNDNNLSVTNMISPTLPANICNNRANQDVTVNIYNGGCTSLGNFPITLSMTGQNSASFTENVIGPINAGETIAYTFTNTVDMSDTGTYHFEISTDYNLDPIHANDTLFTDIHETIQIIVLNSFPYTENFNSTNGAWKPQGDLEFEYGTFTKMNGNTGFGNSWVTKLVGNYNNNVNAYVQSPVYDFTNYKIPKVEFDYKYYTEACCDYTYLQYSIDAGTSWVNISNKWKGDGYNSWNHASYDLNFNTCNLSCVIFRFWFHSDGSSVRDGGFAFDNFEVSNNSYLNDSKAEDLIFDIKCAYSSTETIGFVVRNNFDYWICDDIAVTSVITHPTQATQILNGTFTGGIAPNSQSSIIYSSTADLSNYNAGIYTVTSYIYYPNDINNSNDTIINTIPSVVSTFPYEENFNINNGNWHFKGDAEFEHGSFTKMNGNLLYGNSWVTKLVGNYHNNNNAYVESPVFDFTNLTCPIISFDYKYFTESCCDYTYIQYSTDGTTWTNLDGSWKGNGYDTWIHLEKQINFLAGNSCVMFRFWFHSDGSSVREGGFAFDNIVIRENDFDVKIVSLLEPIANSNLCADRTTQTVSIEVFNNGCSTVSNIPVNLSMTGQNIDNFSEIVPGPIPSETSYSYTFTNTVNMVDTGDYFFQINTNLSSDPNHSNDTINETVHEDFSSTFINTFPYTENFNVDIGSWYTSGNLDFEYGVFSKMNGNNGYGNSWVTLLTGNYHNNVNAYVQSPAFDFSSLNCPKISFDYKTYTEACCDYVYLQYSTNGGSSFTNLSTKFKGNTYSNWNLYEKLMSVLAGNPCVIFRFWFHTDGSATRNGGFAFDNIIIEDKEDDIAVTNFVDPISNGNVCIDRANQTVSIEITNKSCNTFSNIPITLNMTGTNSVSFTETIAGPISEEQVLSYTFSNTVDISLAGNYHFEIISELVSDTYLINDTLNKDIIETYEIVTINSFPYIENFNNGMADWKVTGTSDFEYGTFTKMNGNSNYGNSWVTKLSGNYNNSQNSYVESPVFNFDTMTCIYLDMDFKYYTESCCDYTYLQYSINGGTNWSNLVGNWKGDGYTNWNHLHQDISSLVGNSCVLFRLWFHSDGSSVREGGFAFDNFKIRYIPIDAEIIDITGCWGSEYSTEVTIRNNNNVNCKPTDSIQEITLGYNIDGTTGTQFYSNLNIPAGDIKIITLDNTLIPSQASSVRIWTFNPNSITDVVSENDTLLADLSDWPHCNDHCSNAIPLGYGTYLASQTSNATYNSTEDPGFNSCSGNVTVENTVWFTFETNNSGDSVQINFENIISTPSSNGIQISIDSVGVECDNSTYSNVFCSNTLDTAAIQWGPVLLPSNTKYYIAVDGFAGNDSDFNIVLSGGVTPFLPVELLSFSAICQTKWNLIEWKTVTEINNDYFILEKSNDGINFYEIARINGYGNSNITHKYVYKDFNTSNSKTFYYRLIQVDFDEEKEILKIESLNPCKNNSTNQFVVYPNPSNGKITVSFNTNHTYNNVVIENILGEIVYQKAIKTNDLKVYLNLDFLDSGTYILLLENDDIKPAYKKIILSK